MGVKAPDSLVHRAAVAVDEQRRAGGVLVARKTSEVDLTDLAQRQIAQIGQRVATVVGAGHVHVVDVQQQPAARAFQHFAQEGGLAHRRRLELDVGRWVFEQHATPQTLLHTVDVVAHAGQGLAVVGHRQQVVEEGVAVAGPRQVFRERGRLVAFKQRGQPVQVCLVQRLGTAYRQGDPVQRQRVVLAHAGQEVMEGPAVDHVVFGVHFEEADVRTRGQHFAEVLRLQPDASAPRQAGRRTRRAHRP